MATLIGRSPKNTFPSLLKIALPVGHSDTVDAGLSSALRSIEDGLGNATPLKLSSTSLSLNGALWPEEQGTTGQILALGANNELVWRDASSLLPSPVGQSGKFLKSDGTTLVWATPPSNGGGAGESLPSSAIYTYDDQQNVATLTEVIGDDTKVTTLDYNDNGTVKTQTVEFQGATRIETYSYNNYGKLSGMIATNF